MARLIIDNLGGPAKVAEICGLTSQAITLWKKSGIPKSWEKYLRLLRPDAFVVKI